MISFALAVGVPYKSYLVSYTLLTEASTRLATGGVQVVKYQKRQMSCFTLFECVANKPLLVPHCRELERFLLST